MLRPGRSGSSRSRCSPRDVFGAEPDESFCAACLDGDRRQPALPARAADHARVRGRRADGRERRARAGGRPRAGGARRRAAALAPAAGGGRARAGDRRARPDGASSGSPRRSPGSSAPVALAAADDLVRAELLRLEPPLDFVAPRRARRDLRGHRHATSAPRRTAARRGLLAEAGAEPERAASHLLLVPPAARPVRRLDAAHGRRSGRSRAARASEAVVYLRRALAEPPAGRRARRGARRARHDRARHRPDGRDRAPARGGGADRGAAALRRRRRSSTRARSPTPGFDSAEAVEMYRAAIHSAVGANRPTLVEVATAELINACWAEARVPRHREDAARGRARRPARRRLRVRLPAGAARALGAPPRRRPRAHGRARPPRAHRRHARARVDAGHLLRARRPARGRRGRGRARGLRQRARRGPRRAATCSTSAGCSASARWLLLDRGELRAAEPDVRESIEFSSRARHRGARHVQRRLPLRLPARAGRARRGRARARPRRPARAAAGELPLRRSSSARAAGSGSRAASRRPRSPTSRRSAGSPSRSS